jgi:hypothetical protein
MKCIGVGLGREKDLQEGKCCDKNIGLTLKLPEDPPGVLSHS